MGFGRQNNSYDIAVQQWWHFDCRKCSNHDIFVVPFEGALSNRQENLKNILVGITMSSFTHLYLIKLTSEEIGGIRRPDGSLKLPENIL